MANKVGVIVAVQGQQPKAVLVPSGATIRTALTAAKMDPNALAGAVTLNGDQADLGSRLKSQDYIAVTPKVAGGR